MAKKARVFRLIYFLTMVKSTWVGEWMRIGWRHPLQSSRKVPVYLLVRPPPLDGWGTCDISNYLDRRVLSSLMNLLVIWFWSWKLRSLMQFAFFFQCPERFWGIFGWDPHVSKSDWLHVDILRFSIINLRYILYIFLKFLVIFLEVLNLNQLFLKSNRFICN